MALSYGEQMVHPNWIAKKEEILRRDNYRCRVCNSNLHHLSVHHLCYLPDLLAWEYDNELLITICRRHHTEITYDLPKICGLIAFEVLKMNIDLTTLIDTLKKLKENGRLDKAA